MFELVDTIHIHTIRGIVEVEPTLFGHITEIVDRYMIDETVDAFNGANLSVLEEELQERIPGFEFPVELYNLDELDFQENWVKPHSVEVYEFGLEPLEVVMSITFTDPPASNADFHAAVKAVADDYLGHTRHLYSFIERG